MEFPQDFKINYGIIATVPNPEDPETRLVVHFVGFQNEPGEAEFEHILEELSTDPVHELTDVPFTLYPAPQDLVEKYRKIVEEGEADEY